MEPPPPPPPPHGSNPQGGRSGGLPDGRYDIFVIPPHSAGSGFLYLPSLQTQRNSFLAGVFCTAATFFIYTTAVPVVKEWLLNTINSGASGVFTIVCCVAVVAWALGKTQGEWTQSSSSARAGPSPGAGGHSRPGSTGYGNAGSYSQPQSGPHPHAQSAPPPPPPPPPNHGTSAPPPQSSWQRPQANTKANTTSGKSSWEKAREETRKREEERKRAEELKKRREELEKERQKQREKDALERLERERKEKKEREEKEAAAAAAAAAEKERQERATAAAAAAAARASPTKRPPMPSVRTEHDDDAYSFRPYDRAKRTHKANSAASMYSESSYTPSESTARTTPPPSMRGPYSTKDPDKIIIKGVFSFNNAFMRTPISQLRSAQGNVTDGLILRITTEGLFIDDDVRGVPQREWDVKAWTMKLAEVWCPQTSPAENTCAPKGRSFLGIGADSRHQSSPSQNDSTAFVTKLLTSCQGGCKTAGPRTYTTHRFASSLSSKSTNSDDTDATLTQSCELGGLHVLRATIRDQEGKKYVFVLSQSEGWKVAVGLQRLRRGSQVRALGVAGLPQNEAKAILENLGFL
ncbi:hypothetical protein A1O3_01038 [Capronia epimyces CBS 606.96]|uniref:Uncharacterized protein n=1 Tax=Capronia epimyces CBS 606.96 TaxID=1182542 RepID=W9YTB1_9EURO|nr:uncharacterized protein A1O3_01038 [Capronia epimyces CBS 606.96]EXJ92486.1 hypothetical protein A1O3_01038 [Capronia epimyces CBS 606.96]